MVNTLTKPVSGGISPLDAVMIAGSKIVTERVIAMTPIGDGTIISGAVKMGLAFVLTGAVGGKIGGIIGTGMMVDGGEDIVRGVIGGGTSAAVIGGSDTNQGSSTGGAI